MATQKNQGKNSMMCYNSYNQQYYCQTGWNGWGRWMSFGLIVVAAVLVFFLFSCLTHRRRQRKGLKPYRGTGWIGKTMFGHSLSTYNARDQQQQLPQSRNDNQAASPPSYQQTGGYFGQNSDGVEGQQSMTEIQQPPNTYHGGRDTYSPKENDGLVR